MFPLVKAELCSTQTFINETRQFQREHTRGRRLEVELCSLVKLELPVGHLVEDGGERRGEERR